MLQILGRPGADVIATACALLLAYQTFAGMEARAARAAPTNGDYYRRMWWAGGLTGFWLTFVVWAIWL